MPQQSLHQIFSDAVGGTAILVEHERFGRHAEIAFADVSLATSRRSLLSQRQGNYISATAHLRREVASAM
jgi:hypothetical protein